MFARGGRVTSCLAAAALAGSLGSTAAVAQIAQHVGRTVCAECHAKEDNAWRGSHHDLAMQAAGAKSVLGNFANAKFTCAGITSIFSRRDGKFFVRTDGPDGKLADYQMAKFDQRSHTHHAAGTPGAACSACHMPTTTYMVVDPRHDHSMRIPRPDLSVTLGVPNACTNYHTKRTARWAADAIAKWTGKAPAGYQVLHGGVAKAPTDAPLHHALGLVMVRQKRYPDALKELTEAARLDPANARYAYVQAVALNDTGQAQQSLKVLQAALRRQPYDRELLSALAIYTARAGNRETALDYVKQLRELDPDNPAHAQLGRQIESGR